MLKDIIVKNKLLIEQHNKCDYNDIRHNGEKVGKGICLSPNINIAEKNCGIFNFNKKKQKRSNNKNKKMKKDQKK